MTKPIAFLDADFLAAIKNNPAISVSEALSRLGAQYEIHLTPTVLQEIKAGPTYKNSDVKARIDDISKYQIDLTPHSQSLFEGSALSKANLGGLSILEAASKYDGDTVILSNDQSFFNRIKYGEMTPDRFINDKTSPSFFTDSRSF